MLRDAQTHALPETRVDRARIARGLGYADWAALRAALDVHRARVAAEFDALLAPRRRGAAPRCARPRTGARCPTAATAQALADAGFAEAGDADAALRDFARSPGVRDLSDSARARLDRVLPALLQAAAASTRADAGAAAPAGAAAQRPAPRAATSRCSTNSRRRWRGWSTWSARSALLAERLAAYPLLLDELLDARVGRSVAWTRGAARRLRAVRRATTTMPKPRCRRSTKCARR